MTIHASCHDAGQVGNHQLFALDLGPLATDSAHGISSIVASYGALSALPQFLKQNVSGKIREYGRSNHQYLCRVCSTLRPVLSRGSAA